MSKREVFENPSTLQTILIMGPMLECEINALHKEFYKRVAVARDPMAMSESLRCLKRAVERLHEVGEEINNALGYVKKTDNEYLNGLVKGNMPDDSSRLILVNLKELEEEISGREPITRDMLSVLKRTK